MAQPVLLLLFGLSGVGKTSIGAALAARNWLHVDLDPLGQAVGLQAELRAKAGLFLQSSDFGPLADLMRSQALEACRPGFVIGFGSRSVVSREHIEAARGSLLARYLTGSPRDCLRAFLERERETARGLSREWWVVHNLNVRVDGENLLSYLERPDMAPYRVPAFDGNGTRRPMARIIAELTGTAEGPGAAVAGRARARP